jgi:hypothetical protein
VRNGTRRRPLILLDHSPFPRAWLAGERPDWRAFAVLVVHAGQPAEWTRWACRQYALRWSDDELVTALRFAGRLAPLPGWAVALLRRSVVAA